MSTALVYCASRRMSAPGISLGDEPNGLLYQIEEKDQYEKGENWVNADDRLAAFIPLEPG